MTPETGYLGSIKLVLFDVDGVLTDGTLYLDGHGEAIKSFNVRDGLAIALLRSYGIRTGVLSGKSSAPLSYRIQQLGFDVVVTGQLDKWTALEQIKKDEGLESAQIAYIGDDVVDLPIAGEVGLFYAPSDAHELVIQRADHVLKTAGGRGVAREAAEHILSAGGLELQKLYGPLLRGWRDLDAAQ